MDDHGESPPLCLLSLVSADEGRKAKPYHPILLDTVQMVVRNIERGKAGDSMDTNAFAVGRVHPTDSAGTANTLL